MVFGSDGRIVPGVYLTLLSTEVSEAEASHNYFRVNGSTKEDSSYVLDNMPAGNYLVVINKENKLSGSQPFPTTYYPGVFEKEKATVITLGTGDRRENYDIHIPYMKETVILSGLVQFADEKPAARVRVFFKGTAENGTQQVDASARTDEEGNFTFTLLKGSKGVLGAILTVYRTLDKYETCPQINELMIKQKSGSVEVKTNTIDLDATFNRSGYQFILPVNFCPLK